MLLSILIPTMPQRSLLLARLMDVLAPQLADDIEVLTDDEMPPVMRGTKRNRLMDRAAGDYVCSIDDDDLISPKYIAKIRQALWSKPDCVGFKVRRYVDGREIGYAIHSIKWQKSNDCQWSNWWEFRRVPNHLNPVRRELALATRFDDEKDAGEDHDFANRLRPLLKREVFIDEYLYFYYKTIRTRLIVPQPA